MRHVDAEVMTFKGVIGSPDLREKLPVGDDSSRVLGESRQKSVFSWRKMHFHVGEQYSALHKIDAQHIYGEHQSIRLILSVHDVAQGDSNTGHQFADTERLRQIIIRTRVDTAATLRRGHKQSTR